ncbi:MAG TPA: PAS domain-containing protein, partial [Pyrinomonadaceae bacterium]|nr:PAS domain-containing protein [Pyrinomonadaceae bacterium]
MVFERARELVSILSDPACFVSGDGHIRAANRPLADLLGLPLEALSARALTDLVTDPPEQIKAYLRACTKSADGASASLSVRLRREGSDRSFHCEVSFAGTESDETG